MKTIQILTILKSIRVRHFIYLMICAHALTSLYLHSAVLIPPVIDGSSISQKEPQLGVLDVPVQNGSMPTVETFYNFDFDNVVTPINPVTLQNLLRETHYEENEIEFLVKGFTEGFDISYEGPSSREDEASNIPLQVGSKTDLWAKIMKEVKLKRVAEPFKQIPFNKYIQLPIGLVPKAGGKTRLIFHLSYDFPKSGNESVNKCTPKQYCTVKYQDIEHAIKTCFKWAKVINGKNVIYYTKTDVQSAFRLLPLKKECWNKLVFKAFHPESQE